MCLLVCLWLLRLFRTVAAPICVSVCRRFRKITSNSDRNISLTKLMIHLGPVWGLDSSGDCSNRCLLASWRRGLFIIFMNRSPNAALILGLDATVCVCLFLLAFMSSSTQTWPFTHACRPNTDSWAEKFSLIIFAINPNEMLVCISSVFITPGATLTPCNLLHPAVSLFEI